MILRAPWGTVVGPGIIWGIAVSGHELIQVVLPLHAASFGVTIAWVGFLLSINKIIRVIGYGWVVAAGRRIGPRNMMVIASAIAAVTALLYALIAGPFVLTVGRLAWGLGFAALHLATMLYAMSVVEQAGTRVGLSRALGAIGPILALVLGSAAVPWLGPRDVFLVIGLLMAVAVPLSLTLPRLDLAEEPPTAGRRRFSQPTDLDLFYFAVGLASDGLFIMTVTLLFADRVSTEMAVFSGGLLIGLRYAAALVVSPIGGWLADRFGADRLQVICGALYAVGFALVALGLYAVGGVVIVSARAVLAVLASVVVAQRYGASSMTALSRLSTWTDFGGAIGPMLVGLLIPVFGIRPLYAVSAGVIATAVVVVTWHSRPSPPTGSAGLG
jgi:MFS family permease